MNRGVSQYSISLEIYFLVFQRQRPKPAKPDPKRKSVAGSGVCVVTKEPPPIRSIASQRHTVVQAN